MTKAKLAAQRATMNNADEFLRCLVKRQGQAYAAGYIASMMGSLPITLNLNGKQTEALAALIKQRQELELAR